MGTSGSSRGSGSNTSLVPTWLDQQAAGPLPGGAPADPPGGDGDGTGPGGGTDGSSQTVGQDAPPIRPPPEPGRFQTARRNFSSFARSGGRDTGALRRAVRDYVRSGTRGSANATHRMGSSRAAGSKVLGIFRGIQREGLDATLRHLNLANLVGRPPEDIFLGLTDVICADGGSIDEGIARDAWLETVAELDRLGIDDVGGLTPAQMQELFAAFVTHSIETRLFQEIGTRGLQAAADLNAIEDFERQLRDYIARSVRDSFSGDMSRLNGLNDRQVRDLVDRTYREAWELLEVWGDAEG